MKGWLLVGGILCTLFLLLWYLRPKYERGFSSVDFHWDPPRIIEDVITPQECKNIIEKATPNFRRSTVVGTQGVDASRTSETAWLSRKDPSIRKILERAAELTGKPVENCEDLQVVRYEPGTFYRAHHDSCCDCSDGCLEFENDGGQRVGTLLIYLNSEFTDGETHFPDWDGGQKLKAPPGSAIFFRPLDGNEDKCHPKALHGGLPPSSGVKYVCNVWVRENKFRD